MKEFELVWGRDLSFEPDLVGRITIDETQERVNELMGVSDMDFVRMNCKKSPDESVEGIDETLVKVAEMMGLNAAEIQRYGYKEPVSESETDVVEQITIDETVAQVAKLMGVDVEDIKKYGYK